MSAMKPLSVRVIKSLKGLPTRPFSIEGYTIEEQTSLIALCSSAMLAHSRTLAQKPYANLEGTRLLVQLINISLLLESHKKKIDLNKVTKISKTLNVAYKALFNKDSIQIVNIVR